MHTVEKLKRKTFHAGSFLELLEYRERSRWTGKFLSRLSSGAQGFVSGVGQRDADSDRYDGRNSNR